MDTLRRLHPLGCAHTTNKIRYCHIQGHSKVQKLPETISARALPRTLLWELIARSLDPLAGGDWGGLVVPPRAPSLFWFSGCSPSGLAPQLDPTNIFNRLTPVRDCDSSTAADTQTYNLLLTCYLKVDRLMKLQQLLTPASFQWSSSLFLNILREFNEMTLLGSLFQVLTTL